MYASGRSSPSSSLSSSWPLVLLCGGDGVADGASVGVSSGD